MTRLSIIIVSFNAREALEGCLESLHRAPITTSNEIVVVDNASVDGSVAAVRRWPGVRLIENPANVGFARANNIGIRASSGPTLLLLNSDTIVPAGAVDRLVEDLDAHPAAAVVAPRLVNQHGRAELSFGPMISPLNELRQKMLVKGHARHRPIVSAYVDKITRREQSPDWVSGACLLVRRADAEAVGLLDERYFMYAEDVDFCAAIRSQGRAIRFAPAIEVVHLGGRSVASAAKSTEQAYRRSQLAFYRKHHPRWAPILRLYLRVCRADI